MKTINRRHALSGLAASALCLMAGQVLSQAKPATKAPQKLSDVVLFELINKGGRLRMLSQRMAKAYAQMGLGILPDRAFKILNDSIALFESHVQDLLKAAPTKEIKVSYQIIEKAWLLYKKQLQIAPSLQSAQSVYNSSDEVTKLANDSEELLDDFVGKSVGALVNLSGRQRLLTQRLAKKVLFREWLGLKDNVLQISNDEQEYEAASKNLARDQETTEKIKVNLNLAQTQWLFFQAAIKASLSSNSNSTHLLNVANTSERMLEMYELVTTQFKNTKT